MKFKIWLESNESLPEWLYHVTTAAEVIFREGFKTTLQHQKGTVLGGGFPEAVSFTYNLNRAKLYGKALDVARTIINDPESIKKLSYHITDFSPNYNKLRQLKELLEKTKEDEVVQTALFWLPAVTAGRFPAVFGAKIRDKLHLDSEIHLLKVSTKPGHGKPGPKKWTTNPSEEEYRIYDPENFDNDTIEALYYW